VFFCSALFSFQLSLFSGDTHVYSTVGQKSKRNFWCCEGKKDFVQYYLLLVVASVKFYQQCLEVMVGSMTSLVSMSR
jgi:hypothetical protein